VIGNREKEWGFLMAISITMLCIFLKMLSHTNGYENDEMPVMKLPMQGFCQVANGTGRELDLPPRRAGALPDLAKNPAAHIISAL
jgi:hypothetical protein